MADRLIIPVRVQAGSRRSEIAGVTDGRLKVKTNAPPANGRANKDVIRQLAREFRVPPSRVWLKSGASGRNKTFVIENAAARPDWLTDIAFR